MKKNLIALLVLTSFASADYIPYEKLKNMKFSLESGWRASSNTDTVILSNEDDDIPSVSISNKLYNELSKHPDYKNKFVKSFDNYSLKIPFETISHLSFRKSQMMYEIKEDMRNKICIGRAAIDSSGYVWCEADSLSALFKKSGDAK
jgi:hypothetical protein